MKQVITEIAERHYSAVYCYCVSRLGDPEGAKDCTQEVFLALVTKQNELHDLPNIRPWLYRTADHIILQYRRKNARYVAVPDETLERLTETVMPEFSDSRLKERLPEQDYDLLEQHYLSGYSLGEIARRLGISENAVGQRLSRIRRKIAGWLAEERGDTQ